MLPGEAATLLLQRSAFSAACWSSYCADLPRLRVVLLLEGGCVAGG